MFISNYNLNLFNIRQDILLKHAIGVNSYAKTTPLFQCLNIDQMPQLYFKHKLIGHRQFVRNEFTNNLLYWLKGYTNSNSAKRSYFTQIKKISKLTDTEDIFANKNITLITLIFDRSLTKEKFSFVIFKSSEVGSPFMRSL